MTSRDIDGDAPGAAAEGDALPPWQDMVFTQPEPPDGWTPGPKSFGDDDPPPPQIVRVVNLLPAPEHDIAGPSEIQQIADFIVSRAYEGIDDVFAHEDYDVFDDSTEAWARAIAEHQTGIPYTMPVYFCDGPQKKIAEAVARDGRYPLAGQCQQSVTTALCMGGWDGGVYGDIGSGIDAQAACAKLGKGWRDVPLVLRDWPDDLWDEVTVGSCLFWSAPCPLSKNGETCGGGKHVIGCGRGSGHVAMVLRKHPSERKWQLWDTSTSFNDPLAHATAAKGARMLWESHWWEYIPKTISSGWSFRGIGLVDGVGEVTNTLVPRGRCRLLLRRRSDRKLLYRSEWMSMEGEGLPITWLLRSLRGAPFHDRVEATWCVNSACDAPTKNTPDNRPLLDCTSDAQGNARMSWRPNQGLHDRPSPGDWSPAAPFLATSL